MRSRLRLGSSGSGVSLLCVSRFRFSLCDFLGASGAGGSGSRFGAGGVFVEVGPVRVLGEVGTLVMVETGAVCTSLKGLTTTTRTGAGGGRLVIAATVLAGSWTLDPPFQL